jgi:hypothetical protein
MCNSSKLKKLKLFISLIILLSVAFASIINANAAEAPNAERVFFPILYEYQPYTDLSGSEWYFDAAVLCRQTGLIDGNSRVFNGDEIMSFGECSEITLMLRKEYCGVRSMPILSLNRDYYPKQPTKDQRLISIIMKTFIVLQIYTATEYRL